MNTVLTFQWGSDCHHYSHRRLFKNGGLVKDEIDKDMNRFLASFRWRIKRLHIRPKWQEEIFHHFCPGDNRKF
jgi:hypothetical protein